jgi:phage terminase large subunit
MRIKAGPLMRKLRNNNKRIVLLQGSSSSGKTYSVLQHIIIQSLTTWHNETIDILRRTSPSLNRSALKDFIDILSSAGLYNPKNHNKTEKIILLGTNQIRFYSSDDQNKMRGPRRDRVYFNEVLEFKRIDVMQVLMRTNKEIWMDYNPSEEFSWVYDEIIPRDDCNFIKSTYKQNPFLPVSVRQELERLKEIDPNLWRIYGLGEKGVGQAKVFTNIEYLETPWEEIEGEDLYGMDFGYNDPTVLVHIKYHEQTKQIFIKELMRVTQHTTDMIINKLEEIKTNQLITPYHMITCDNNRPEIIEELRNNGWNVRPAQKTNTVETGSVMRGIDFIKKNKVFINKDSTEAIKEFRNYSWKVDKDDKVLDHTPVKLNDHSIDATRYALERYSGKKIFITGI